MPLDGIFISRLCDELGSACGSRIDKIFQPSKDELVITLRASGFAKKLLLCARSGSSRVHFTEENFENPPVPPMFCMLMRKYLSGGKLLSVTQDGYERAITLNILATDELGDRRELRLITELIGNGSNIILVGADGRIVDAVRRSDIETGGRLIQPGAIYTPPSAQQKQDPKNTALAESAILEKRELPLSRAILESISGISPLVARELASEISPSDETVSLLGDDERSKLKAVLAALPSLCDGGTPYMISDENGIPKDFSYMPIRQYGNLYGGKSFDGFSELLDGFYSERDRLYRLRRSANDVYKTLQNLALRTDKKLALRRRELEKCTDRDKYRIYGELIKANISKIGRGAATATVPNYYDENLRDVQIPLDPALSPAANSAKYFKEYRKKCTAEQTLGGLIAECERERAYITSVRDALDRAETVAEILDIRDELESTGYLKKQKGKTAKRQTLKPREYISSDGYKILVGRNNTQNDLLTLRTAKKDDLWLHTKNIHGSHVIVFCDGKEPPVTTIMQAAQLAAYHSQARSSSQVPVDYTKVKNVKKPAGAKPGMVIYKTNNTVFVTPKEL